MSAPQDQAESTYDPTTLYIGNALASMVHKAIIEKTLRVDPIHNVNKPVIAEFNSKNMFKGFIPKDCCLKPTTIRTDPNLPESKLFEVRKLNIAGYHIKVPIVGNAVNNDYFDLFFYSWASLRGNIEGSDPSSTLISAAASLVLNILRVDCRDALFEAFNSKNIYVLLADMCTMDEFRQGYLENVLENRELRSLYTELNELSERMRLSCATILSCFMFILIGKRITTNTSEDYFLARYKAIGSQPSLVAAAAWLVTKKVLPDYARCELYYSAISGCHEYRRIIFESMRSVIRSSHQFAYPMSISYQYLMWTEMTHVYLIDKFIVRKHPEVMSMAALITSQPVLDRLLTYVNSKPVCDKPFLKILYPPSETKILNSNHMYYLLAAAKIIEAYYVPTYTNYLAGNNSIIQRMKGTLETYLRARTDYGTYFILSSAHSHAMGEELKILLQAAATSASDENNVFTRD